MDHHSVARKILEAAWRDVHGREGTPKELLFTQAVAWLENEYGRAGQFAPWAAAGSFNWGSLESERAKDGTCPPGRLPGSDAKNARCFFVYPSDEEAARAYVTNFTGQKPGYGVAAWPVRNAKIVRAMNEGTSVDVATAMKAQEPGDCPPGRTCGYFEADPTAYSKIIDGAVMTVAKGLGVPIPVIPVKAIDAKGPLLVLGGLGLLGLLAWVTGTGPFDKPSAFVRQLAAKRDKLRSDFDESDDRLNAES